MHGECVPELFPRTGRAAYAAFVRLARGSAATARPRSAGNRPRRRAYHGGQLERVRAPDECGY